MKRNYFRSLLLISALCFLVPVGNAQEEVRVAWQVTSFDITASMQDRTLNGTAILTAKNVGRASGSTLTFRLNSKAVVKTVSVSGANATFRAVPEAAGNVQRITATLPAQVASGASVNLTVSYSVPVESNIGLAAISPVGSQFLPLSFWYPLPNTPFSVRGGDTAPFRLSVNGANIVSSGVEKAAAGAAVFEQSLNAQPFFVQGEWDRVEGAGDSRGVIALIAKGVPADERKQAEALVAIAGAARAYFASLLGSAPDVPIRLISVRRGSGFHDGGTVLLDASAFRRGKVDAASAMLVAETVAQLWIGGQTAVRGEGGGLLRDGLTRYLATQFIEKQFGRDAAQSELMRQRITYVAVAKRDAPLARATQLDDSYFSAVPNKGAMVWRLVEQKLGRDAFLTTLKTLLQSGRETGISVASVRAALVEKGGESFKVLLNHQLDQVTDTDLMIGLPQQRGADWLSALRNLGAVDVTVKVLGVSDRGEQLLVEATVPARGFGEAIFRTPSKLVRAEIDPEKLYPQLDFSNDVAPRTRSFNDVVAEATRFLNSGENNRAETVARELMAIAPQMQESRIILARTLLAQNRTDEAERIFRAALDDPLPTATSVAWANIGLGQIALRKGQAVEAARRFNDAVRADADYATSVLARAERIKAEGTNNTAPVDEAARGFISQLDAAILAGKKIDLEARIASGELVRFIGGIVGTQPEIWQTRVLRTELLDANTMLADVSIQVKELGQERSGTALLVLARTGGSWKLWAIELFEVR